jgi:hypothetical protein
MVMVTTSRIKQSATNQTSIPRIQVFSNGQLKLAIATKHNFGCVMFDFRPHFVFVSSKRFMTGNAGIIIATAFVFDGNDIQIRMPMSTLSLVRDFKAKYCWHIVLKYNRGRGNTET